MTDPRSRIAQRIGDRVQNQQPSASRPERPALAGPGGTVSRLGGDPLPGRATQSSGAIPVGGTAQRNQGVIQGAPRGRDPQWLEAVPAQISGGHLLIVAPEEITYTLIRKNDQERIIIDVDSGFAVGSGTATFNYGVGDSIPIDESLTLTLSALSEDAAGFSVSFRFK